jgi:hypothetical protein
LPFARRFQALVNNYEALAREGKAEAEALRIKAGVPAFLRNYDPAIDRQLFIALGQTFWNDCPSEYLPTEWRNLKTRTKGNIHAAADIVYGKKSVLANISRLEQILAKPTAKNIKTLSNDPALRLALSLYDNYFQQLRPAVAPASETYEDLMAQYLRLMQRVWPDKYFRPDANSTLRLTYGRAEGSAPRDGLTYNTFTTARGILEKYIPGDPDYDVPADFIELLRNADFGIYGLNGDLPVCFLGSNHTTGGNSGSPTLNGRGHFIGINFDRTWESTMSDIMFDPDICRNIMVDSRYILFVTDKYARASHLLSEMTLTKTGESPSEGH